MSSVYDQVRADIISGELESGTVLVEVTVAERYGVSRTPVREALLRLEHDGLVARLAQGMVVRERSPEEILEIYEARIALEGAVAAAAARRRSALDLARIRNASAQMSTTRPVDAPVAMQLNHNYHTAVWAAGHNATMVDLLVRLEAQLSRYTSTTLLHPDRWPAVLHEHAAITEAITDQNATEAERLTKLHFEQARAIRLEIFAEGH